MTVGEKIKYIRTLKKITQKELGIAVGFSPSTADVRIRQYESNKMIPKYDKLCRIASALDVDISALSDINISTEEELMHTLFELEMIYDIDILKKDDSILLSFNSADIENSNLLKYLKFWFHIKEEYKNGKITDYEYELWKTRFPLDLFNTKNAEKACLSFCKKNCNFNISERIIFKNMEEVEVFLSMSENERMAYLKHNNEI